MNIAVIGSGGREHAIAHKISESLKDYYQKDDKLYIIPGNAGTAFVGINVQIKVDNKEEILEFCKNNTIELVVIGPEQPLVDGLSDFLKNNGILVFGPSAEAARIESEKAFAKALMKKYNIPSADYVEYNQNEIGQCLNHLKTISYPIVLKANGLAAGKGVIICTGYKEAEKSINDFFVNRVFGEAGSKVVIEEFLEGDEASIFAITDGIDYICLPAAQDHKRIGDNDTGKNTGGMGSYAPTPLITTELLLEIEERIIQPTLLGMRKEGFKFQGCLYCGLMITKDGPKVIEFNCRFGDPETQSVLPLLEGDFIKLLLSCAKGSLDKKSVKYNGGASVCVIAASSGYPDKYESGFEILGLDSIDKETTTVFHSGTKIIDNKVLSNGGRVLGVTSFNNDNNILKAIETAYQEISKIEFKNMVYRKDIGKKAFKY